MTSYSTTKRACYLSYFISAIINNFAPLLFFTFSKQFSLSILQLGLIVTLNFFTQIITDYLGSLYASKVGYRAAIITAHVFAFTGLMSLGTLPYLIEPYTGIIISVVLYAVGSGIIEVMVSPMIEALPESGKRASMSFLHSFFCWGQVGVVLISTLYFRIFSTENWRYLSYIYAVLPVISILMFIKAPICRIDDEESGFNLKKIFKDKFIYYFLIIMLCSGASELAVSQWASYFAQSGLKVSKTVGDLLGPCLFALLMGAARVLYGLYSEKIKIKTALAISAALCVISYMIISLSPNPIVSLLGCGLCGFSVGVMWPGTLSFSAHKIKNANTAMFGMLALSGDIGCTLGPTLISMISSKFTLNGDPIKAGILFSAVFPLIILISVFALKSKKSKADTRIIKDI